MRGARKNKKYKVTPLTLSVAEAAWLAGLLDGEGSVCFSTQHSKQVKRKRVDLVVCSNTDEAILYEVIRLVPWIAVQLSKKKGTPVSGQPQYKANADIYKLYVTSQEGMIELLGWLTPYLRGAKRGRAEAALIQLRRQAEE